MDIKLSNLELEEGKKKAEKAKKEAWSGLTEILGMGFAFVGGCVLSILTIDKTPHWVKYLAIGGAIITFLLCLVFYSLYKENSEKVKKIETEFKKRK